MLDAVTVTLPELSTLVHGVGMGKVFTGGRVLGSVTTEGEVVAITVISASISFNGSLLEASLMLLEGEQKISMNSLGCSGLLGHTRKRFMLLQSFTFSN